MSISRIILTGFISLKTTLASAFPMLAAQQPNPQVCPWPWWHGHGASFWWIFPFTFFVLMILMFIFMARRGGRGWHDRMMGRSEFHDAMKRGRGEPSETAMDILNKRYAKGEIDKQEYEDKKAVIQRSD